MRAMSWRWRPPRRCDNQRSHLRRNCLRLCNRWQYRRRRHVLCTLTLNLMSQFLLHCGEPLLGQVDSPESALGVRMHPGHHQMHVVMGCVAVNRSNPAEAADARLQFQASYSGGGEAAEVEAGGAL